MPWRLGSVKHKPESPALDERAVCLCHHMPVPAECCPPPRGHVVCISCLGTGPGWSVQGAQPLHQFPQENLPPECHEFRDVSHEALAITLPSAILQVCLGFCFLPLSSSLSGEISNVISFPPPGELVSHILRCPWGLTCPNKYNSLPKEKSSQ